MIIVIYFRLLNVPYYRRWRKHILPRLHQEIIFLDLKTFQELATALSVFDWNITNADLFIQDFKSIQNEVQWSLEGSIDQLSINQQSNPKTLMPISSINNANQNTIEKILNS